MTIHHSGVFLIAGDNTLAGSTKAGETEADTPVEGVVQLLLCEDGHTGVGGHAPLVTEVEAAHDGLVVEVYRSTD